MNFTKTLSCILLFFLSAISGISQTEKIDKEALKETANPSFPEAKAVILYSEQNTYITNNHNAILLVTTVKKRIKFYGEDFDHATQHLFLYQGSSGREEASKIKGTTYNLSGGKIVETKLENNGIFEKDINKYTKEVSFTMPAVKKGSIIEFEYIIRSPYFWDLDEFPFQYDIPLIKAIIQVNTPDNFLYSKTHKGKEIAIEKTEKKIDQRLGMQVNISTYTAENIPALKDEKFVDNIKNYRSGILYELIFISYSDGTTKKYSVSWDDVAKTISESEDYKYKLNNKGVFKTAIDALIASETDTLQKIKTIYNHVKSTIKWDGNNGKYFDKGIRAAYNEGKGNVADINLTLVAMLRYAGVDAYPVVISTRDNLKPVFPTLEQLNYVIVLAQANGKSYFMDATEKFSKLNLLPIRDYNGRGMLINGTEWQFVDVIQPEPSNLVQMLNVTLNPNLSASGKVRTRLSNHYAYFHRKEIASESKEDYVREKESELNNIVIANYESKYDEKSSGTVNESYEYQFENSSQAIGNKLFFNPLLFLASSENPFKSETRSFPINFGFPFAKKTIVNIKIPAGYKVVSLPESIRVKLGENLGQFDYIISSKGSFISLSMNFSMNKAVVLPAKYEFIKGLYDQMIQKQQESIVLEKIEG